MPWPERGELRRNAEVHAAALVLVAVLSVIDAGFLGQPVLIGSLAPLAFVLLAAVVPLSLRLALAWIAAFAGLALVLGDARVAGLAYPAVAFLPLLYMRGPREHS